MSDEIRVSVASAGPGRALSLYWRDPLTGKRKVVSARTKNEKEAERAAAVLQDELNTGRYVSPSKVTWADFRRRYEAEKLATLAPKTQDLARTALNHLERVLNIDKLAKVTSATMSRFQAKLREEGMRDTTLGKTLRHLRAALSWAVSVGLLVKVPEMHPPRAGKGQSLARGRAVTTEEFERILGKVAAGLVDVGKSARHRKGPPKRKVQHKPVEVAPAVVESWRHYLRGLWLSGLRLEESLALSWDQDEPFAVDLSGRRPAFRIFAEAQKARRDEVLPMTPDFAEFIAQTPEAERHGRVFKLVGQRGGRPMTPAKVGVIVARIGERAGVVVNKADGKYASAHDLRRAFGTRWAKRVMPAVLKRLMRHSSITTTMSYYVDLDAADVADELWAKFGATYNTPYNNRAENGNGPGPAEPATSLPAKR